MTIYTDAANFTTKTTLSSSDLYWCNDLATISTKTGLSSIDVENYVEAPVISNITIPDVIVEQPTTLDVTITLSGSPVVNQIITATVSIDVSGGETAGGGGGTITDPDEPGYSVYYSTTGQWGSFDGDDGIIS